LLISTPFFHAFLSSPQCSKDFPRFLTLANFIMTSSFNPGGMPTARRQLFDDHFILEEPDLNQIQPTRVPNYGQGYNNSPMPAQQQHNRSSLSSISSSRLASSNGNRMSFGLPPSSSNSKPSFFGFKKKARDDFDEDEGEAFDYSGNFNADAGANISMHQLGNLRDRDRYPSLSGDPPTSSGQSNGGRTMSLRSLSNFDTTPIIPTFTTNPNSSKSQAKNYRQNLTNSHRQMLRGEGNPLPPPPNANFQQPYPPTDRSPPMQNVPIDPGQGRPGSSLGYQGQNIHNNEYNGRTMSLGGGGYMRGPPVVNGSGPPMGKKFFPRQYGPEGPPGPPGSLPPNGTNPMSYGGRPPMNSNQPTPMQPYPSQGPGYNVNPGYAMRSRSNSKSNSPCLSSNNMSRTNSGQTLSTTADNSPKQNPVSGNAIAEGEVTGSSTITDKAPLSSVLQSSSASSTISFSEQKGQNKYYSSIESAKSTGSTSSSSDNTPHSDLVKKNMDLLDEVRLVTSELADSIRCEFGLPESSKIELEKADINKDNLMMNRQERVMLLVSLQEKLDTERRQRLVAEEILQTVYDNTTFKSVYDAIELERRAALSEQKLQNALVTNKIMAKKMDRLRKKLRKLGASSDESDQSDDDTFSNVPGVDTELAAKNTVQGNSLSSVERIKTVEAQRDALREALRTLRERKDQELKESTECIRQLELKLKQEKNNSVNNNVGNYRALPNGSASTDPSLSSRDSPSPLSQTQIQKGEYSPMQAEWAPAGFNPNNNTRNAGPVTPDMSLPRGCSEQLPRSVDA
jgi:hypothetical protein